MDNIEQFILLFTSSYIAVMMLFLTSLRKNRLKRKRGREKDFIKVFKAGLNNGSITSLGDVYTVYKGFYGYNRDNDLYRNEINIILRKSVVELIIESTNDNNEDNLIQLKKQLDSFIVENEKLAPFSELSSTDRNLLIDITKFVENNELDIIPFKLEELSRSINTKDMHLEKTQKQNRWSVPLAIIGLILTIFFGLLSL